MAVLYGTIVLILWRGGKAIDYGDTPNCSGVPRSRLMCLEGRLG
jgi:hypothetical protein